MSNLIVTKVAAPSTPATNKSTIYVDTTTRRVMQLDDNGVSNILNNNGLQDRNILTNGGMSIQQRVAVASTAIPSVSTTTRAGQVADCWAVTTGNATTTSWSQTDSSGTTETGLGSRYYGRITQVTNAAKFIFSQWVLNSEMAHLRGNKVRVSIKVKNFVGSNQVYKLGLLQLTAAGTVDVSPAFTSAIGADNVVPTWGTNLSAITPDASPTGENGTINGAFLDITSTAAWVRSSCVFTVPSDAKNLVVVLIKNTAGGTTDSTGVAEAQMTQGAEIVEYVEPPQAETLVRCQRRFCKSFPLTVVPAVSLSEATAGSGVTGIVGKAGTGTVLGSQFPIQFPVVMWKTPTLTYFTPTSTGAQVMRLSGVTPIVQTGTATRASSLTDRGCTVTCTTEASANVVIGDLVGVHYTADAELVA